MKTITLQKAFEILQGAVAVIVDQNALVYPSLDNIRGDKHNEFLFLKWEEDGHDFYLKFEEGNNQYCKVTNSSLILEDFEGEEVTLTILQTANLEEAD